MKKFVRDILKSKGEQVWSIGPHAKVFEALELMAEKNIGAVMVRNEDRVVGILSERDYARKVILEGKSSKDLEVGKIMSPRVVIVSPDRQVEEAMAVMTDKHIRHLPVMDGDELVGVISIGDVVAAAIAERDFAIEQLESYIRGDY